MAQNHCLFTVIVTFNAEKFIRKALESLQNSSVQTQVVIVDNASTDETISIVKSDFPEVELIESSQNLGFGKGNNIGINLSLQKGADYVFLLNQDAWIETNAIEHLVSAAKRNPSYGILSPIHCQYDSALWHTGFNRYIEQFTPSLLSEHRLSSKYAEEIYTCGFLPAAIWLLRRDCLERVGGFDPIYFMYREDNDLVARVHALGYKLGVVPNAIGHHREGKEAVGRALVKRMKYKYFGDYASILKYSNHSFVKRYASIAKSVLQNSSLFLFKRQYVNFLSSILAFWKVLSAVRSIERSRHAIANTEGAFLGSPSPISLSRLLREKPIREKS